MEVLYPRCAGLDVHKATLTACVRVAEGARVRREVREFGTCTRDLLALSEWLHTQGCTHVALESTGVYWKPVWHVLEGDRTLVLANAAQVRNVPGRKSDVNDATWLADLLAHGLIRPSFVPPRATQEVRGLTRTRTQLVREAARHLQRIEKVLEDANLKLTSVLSEVGGVPGRAVLRALVDGETDPERLAEQVTTRVKASRAELVEALRGSLTGIPPLRAAAASQAAGVSETTARVILGEIGTDMTRFPTDGEPRDERAKGGKRLGEALFHLRDGLLELSKQPAISCRGLGCVPASRRARGNGGPLVSARAPAGSRPRSCRPPGRRSRPRARTFRRSTSGSRRAGARRRPSSPWRPRCSSPPTTSSPPARPTATSAPPTSTAATRPTSPNGSCDASLPSATGSSSAPPPESVSCQAEPLLPEAERRTDERSVMGRYVSLPRTCRL